MMSRLSRPFWGWGLAVVLALVMGTAVLTYLTAKSTADRFEQIAEGMRSDDVYAIMGPDSEFVDNYCAVWRDGKHQYAVWFEDDFVVKKSSGPLRQTESKR
jgi:hypothetical protein